MKRTRKFLAACNTAHSLNLELDDDQIYEFLEDAGFKWNTDTGKWENWDNLPSDEPTEMIMVRLWADAEIIQELADMTIKQFFYEGLSLLEASKPYPCRPPKQQESRIYLKFYPERKFK